MQVNHSPKISEVLTNLAKQKQLKHAKKLGLWHTNLTRVSLLRSFAETLGNKYGIPDLVFGTSRESATSIFFDEPEAIVLQKLEAIKPSKKGKTALKVLVKMIYSRIVKLQKQIDNIDFMAQQQLQAQAQMQAQTPSYNAGGWAQNWTSPIITRKMLIDVSSLPSHYGLNSVAEDLVLVATREDVTEEILNQAWDLWETRTVMVS